MSNNKYRVISIDAEVMRFGVCLADGTVVSRHKTYRAASSKVRLLSLNAPLLKATLAYIEAHPKEWDQGRWHCGTSYCFAGHAARIANGGVLPFDPSSFSCEDETSDLLQARTVYGQAVIRNEAKVALGIGEYWSKRSFTGTNTLKELKQEVKAILRGE